MQKETAKRLTKLAAEKTGFTIAVNQEIWYHTSLNYSRVLYRVTYFTSENDCEVKDFKTWTETQAFLKRLVLEGLPDVQKSNADDV